LDEHEIIITSHPSGYSCHGPLNKGQYPAFSKTDIFGKINTYLKKYLKQEIIWQV
jgi:uracil DNA glycosylase